MKLIDKLTNQAEIDRGINNNTWDERQHYRIGFKEGFIKARELANEGFIRMLDEGSFGTNDILKLGEEEV